MCHQYLERNFNWHPEVKWQNNHWSNTDWPFSMENMSCSWGGGGVPAYLPPLFLHTKQAMSTTNVRTVTAHRVPINQPRVEKLVCFPLSTPGNKTTAEQSSKTDFPHTWGSQAPLACYMQLFWKQKTIMDSSLRMSSCHSWLTYPSALMLCLFSKNIRWEQKCKHANINSHIHRSQYHFVNKVPVSLLQLWREITTIYQKGQVFLLSPLTWVWIISSKMLALSSNPLAMRRTVYTAPGLSPSITWKLWEVFTASEILQLPSPSTRSA